MRKQARISCPAEPSPTPLRLWTSGWISSWKARLPWIDPSSYPLAREPDRAAGRSPERGGRAGTIIIFVRHGNAYNPRRLIYGRLPRVGLSAQGREEIERTARILASVPLAAIYTSPLLRARESAARIAAWHPGAPVRRCRWLTEVHTAWQGESLDLYDRIKGFTFYSPKGPESGETIEDVFRRMDRALQMVLRRHPGQTTVCVSHGDPIKILQVGYSGRELTLEVARLPDPPEASLVAFHFWHPDALPVIAQVDPTGLEKAIQGKQLRGPRRARRRDASLKS